jgi:hypothetical protein
MPVDGPSYLVGRTVARVLTMFCQGTNYRCLWTGPKYLFKSSVEFTLKKQRTWVNSNTLTWELIGTVTWVNTNILTWELIGTAMWVYTKKPTWELNRYGGPNWTGRTPFLNLSIHFRRDDVMAWENSEPNSSLMVGWGILAPR